MSAEVSAVLAGSCWGVGEVFAKRVLHTGRVRPITAITLRSTVAVPFTWMVFAIATAGAHLRTQPLGWPRAGSTTRSKLVLGLWVLAAAGGMILFYAALSLGEISRVKPIAFTVAPATAVLMLTGSGLAPSTCR